MSQLRVGGGAPTAEHSSSRGLFTATFSSSGEPELDIFGGSGLERSHWSKRFTLFNPFAFYSQIVIGITENSEVEALCAAPSLVAGHAAVEARI